MAKKQKKNLETPAPLPAPAGAVAPANLPKGPQVIATLPAKKKAKRKAAKAQPAKPVSQKKPKCVAKDMGHHYCLAKGCPVCADLASRG